MTVEATPFVDATALMPTYKRYPVTLVRGEGLRVTDDAGNTYTDFAGGIACVPIGHSHPRWVAAVQEQVATLTHVSNLFSTIPQQRLADRLTSLAGFGRVFLCNSGAEANEAALKIARRWGRPQGRTRVVALEGSFHGRTFATLAATGHPEKHVPFEPLPEGFIHVPPGDADALSAAVDERTAAVLLEPVLGEGGVVPLPPEYLAHARRVCDERGALLLFDEVQTGVGRCGNGSRSRAWTSDPTSSRWRRRSRGGLPIGAAVAREDLAFGPGDHGSTFGGGPVPCAGALAVLDVIEERGAAGERRGDGRTTSGRADPRPARRPASTARPAGADCWSERRSRRRRPRRRSSSRCCAAAF